MGVEPRISGATEALITNYYWATVLFAPLLASGQATQPNGPKAWVKFMGTSPHPAKQPSNSKFTTGPVCPSDRS